MVQASSTLLPASLVMLLFVYTFYSFFWHNHACRLRITLSAAHTRDDLVKLTSALSQCIYLRDSGYCYANGNAKL